MYYLFQQRLNNLMNFSGRCQNADGLLEKIHTRKHKHTHKIFFLSPHTHTHTHTHTQQQQQQQQPQQQLLSLAPWLTQETEQAALRDTGTGAQEGT